MSKYSLLQYRKTQNLNQIGAQGGPLRCLIHSVANHQKNLRGPFGEKIYFLKISQYRDKTERGDFLVASSFVCYAKTGTTLIVAGPKSTIWHLKDLYNFRQNYFYFGHFRCIEKKH